MTSKLIGPMALAGLLLLSTSSFCAAFESAYTKFNTDDCPHEEGTDAEDEGIWTCPGYDGIDVLVSAGDQRMFISFGPDRDSYALTETFSGFNDAFDGTVEWLIEKTDGQSKPFATILRWNVMTGNDEGTPSGRILVITRLGDGGVCHVGYVDARANPNANELARKLAEDHARTFQCGKEKPLVVGATTMAIP